MPNLVGTQTMAFMGAMILMLASCTNETSKIDSNNTISATAENIKDTSEPDLRDRFMNEEILDRDERARLANAMSVALEDMLLVDLNDCTEIYRSQYQPIRSLGDDPLPHFSVLEKQNFSVFLGAVTDARNRESRRRYKENLTPIQRQIQKEGKRVSTGISMFNCEDGFAELDGRYSTADKLNCVHLPEVTQSLEDLQLELVALWDFCTETGWHFMENGTLDGYPLKFDPSIANENPSE